DRGWGENRSVPVEVGRIERPEGYAHYRANVNARVGEPGYRHTDYSRPAHRSPAPRYVEHPPRERGGQNYRAPQQRGRTETRPAQERGRTETRPAQERGHTETRPAQERGHTEEHAPKPVEKKPEHHDTHSNDKKHH